MGRTFKCVVASVSLLMWAALSSAAPAVEPSSKAAGELVAMMKSRNLETIALEDPEHPDHFIAAMLIPGVQLLVVGAKSTAPDYVRSQLGQQLYRDVYATLQSAAVLDTKVFFQDMGSDGLSDDGSVDIMYEHGTKQTNFNGDWKTQKMSKAEYQEKLRKADADYSRMLSLLAGRLRDSPGTK